MTHNASCLIQFFLRENQNIKTEMQQFEYVNRDLIELVRQKTLRSWLLALVAFCNKKEDHNIDWLLAFRELSLNELQLVLNYMSQTWVIDLINALYFYKLHPDKLFTRSMHPEQLVSVHNRLEGLHHFVEKMQIELYFFARQNSLETGVDHLFHDNDLPEGILIEIKEEYQILIQSAVKNLQSHSTFENEAQLIWSRLSDLKRAYKYCFDPNRLIDAAMILQRRLMPISTVKEVCLSVFFEKMQELYKRLATTECLDLYGYFSNNDSRYLMLALFSIVNGSQPNYLPPLSKEDHAVILSVFQTLSYVMEALRAELKNRHITTKAYAYDRNNQYAPIGRRNREAVLRILAVYSETKVHTNENLEQLFSIFEES